MYDALANSAEIIAGVLGIAVTVVAIIVELAATRFNHRITHIFIREPLNAIVLGFFVLTTLMCVWVSATSDADGSSLLHTITMMMITLSLIVLLPYFVFVFSFISPVNVVRRISRSAEKTLRKSTDDTRDREHLAQAVDEIQDVLRSAIDSGDRDIAMHCIRALADLLTTYESLLPQLSDAWLTLDPLLARDPDFVSLEPGVIQRINDDRSWFEYKVLSQFYTALGLCIPRLRDVANLISIKTREIAVDIAEPNSTLQDLCLVSFNSYLRTTINMQDPRTTYYILSQYRMVAEDFITRQDAGLVASVSRRFHYYGQLGFNLGQPFILEVCAFDLVQLLERCVPDWPEGTDCLLDALLELDQEIRSETQEESLAGVRRAQLQAAAILLEADEQQRANRVIEDIASEAQLRISRLIAQLKREADPDYWELTPRGVNFGYIAPERHQYLDTIRDRLNDF